MDKGSVAASGRRITELDVLLVVVGSAQIPATRASIGIGIPPLGTAYLAAVMRRRGLRVRIADLNVPGWTRERLTRCLRLQRPRVVGLSCMTESYRNAVRLASWIRREAPGTWTVAGGPHVTFEDAPALRTGAFDVIVRGEGERTVEELFPRLVAGRGPSPSIGGISYREGRRIIRTPERDPEADLDRIPWPARDLLCLERYSTGGAILTGRGCPGRCLFCAAAAMSGGRHRVRDTGAVIEEISFLRRLGVREIAFLDDTLTGDRERLERLLDGIERAGLRMAWSCESRIESVDPPLLRRMARLGCHSIQYGIESGSRESQRRVGKGTHRLGTMEILRATDRAGIRPVCSFILGLPWEDEATTKETIEMGLRLQRELLAGVGFGVLVCYPGTQFWKRGTHFGLKRVTRDLDQYTMHVPTCSTTRLHVRTLRRLQFDATLRQMREMPRALLDASRMRLPESERGRAEA